MVFEGLDPGDETRRFGNYVGFEHPDDDGTSVDDLTIPRGSPVTYDGTDIAVVTGDDSDTVAGIVANYDVYGDTGQEQVKGKANVKMRGEVLADLSAYVDGTATVSEGGTLGANSEIYVIENVRDNLYRVQVR